ncbi:hypothetical protein OTU49_003715 [Cherax quadricarinatus]|uniref:Secreted protein n=1 Tax=Cherax quadricarinatus TaxID=27406 RepID=A0AAW0XHZ7_CHEQU
MPVVAVCLITISLHQASPPPPDWGGPPAPGHQHQQFVEEAAVPSGSEWGAGVAGALSTSDYPPHHSQPHSCPHFQLPLMTTTPTRRTSHSQHSQQVMKYHVCSVTEFSV